MTAPEIRRTVVLLIIYSGPTFGALVLFRPFVVTGATVVMPLCPICFDDVLVADEAGFVAAWAGRSVGHPAPSIAAFGSDKARPQFKILGPVPLRVVGRAIRDRSRYSANAARSARPGCSAGGALIARARSFRSEVVPAARSACWARRPETITNRHRVGGGARTPLVRTTGNRARRWKVARRVLV